MYFNDGSPLNLSSSYWLHFASFRSPFKETLHSPSLTHTRALSHSLRSILSFLLREQFKTVYKIAVCITKRAHTHTAHQTVYLFPFSFLKWPDDCAQDIQCTVCVCVCVSENIRSVWVWARPYNYAHIILNNGPRCGCCFVSSRKQ